MVDMKLGSLVAEIFVDGGTRPHYGSGDIINGKVILEYKRYSNRLKSNKSTSPTVDLFAPLKLEVFLRGRTKIIVKQERDMPVDHGSPLFLRSVEIHNAPFTSKPEEKHEFPFKISFPETLGPWGLPPSFHNAFAQFPDTVDLAIRYRLGVTVSTPGIDIKTIAPEHGKQPEIQYDLPRPSATTLNANIPTHQQKFMVQTHMLLPETERPQGIQQRFRAVFETSPKFHFEINCTQIQHIWPGHRPNFNIRIRRTESENSTTTLSFPEVIMTSFKADLISYTWCDTSKRLKGPFERFDSRTIQRLECRTPLPLQLTKSTDFEAKVVVDDIDRWPSSFRHALLSRRYFIKVRMKLKVAEQSVPFEREFEVKMVTRPRDLEGEEGGPSNSNGDGDGNGNGMGPLPPPPYSGSDLEPYRE